MAEPTQEQIEINYKAFQEKLPDLIKSHPGKLALMHDGEVVAFFDTMADAYTAGKKYIKKMNRFLYRKSSMYQ